MRDVRPVAAATRTSTEGVTESDAPPWAERCGLAARERFSTCREDVVSVLAGGPPEQIPGEPPQEAGSRSPRTCLTPGRRSIPERHAERAADFVQPRPDLPRAPADAARIPA